MYTCISSAIATASLKAQLDQIEAAVVGPGR